MFLGNVVPVSDFDYQSGTGSYDSCSFTQKGRMYIVGGDSARDFTRQISVVEDCRLRKVKELQKDFHFGACNNFVKQDGSEEALLCFSFSDKNGCLT